MILSVSRRTDIPAFYGKEFLESIHEGFIEVVNPFNRKKKLLDISTKNVDCIVFWSKNYIPFIKILQEIEDLGYKFYLNYTINNYSRILENIANENSEIIENCIELSKKYTIFWRYDPILITNEMNLDFHIKNFSYLSSIFRNNVNRVIINYFQNYKKSIKRLSKNNIQNIILSDYDKIEYGKLFQEIANYHNIPIYSCSKILYENGITQKSNCVDKLTIEKLLNKELDIQIAPTYEGCNCYKSIDIGIYSTCKNNCLYCYANR